LLKWRRVELSQELTLGDAAVEIGVQARDHARHLAADLNGGDGGKRSRGSHGHGDRAAVDFLGAELFVLVSSALAGGKGGNHQYRCKTFHRKTPSAQRTPQFLRR